MAIADFVQAERVREEVISICEEWIAANTAPDDTASEAARNQFLKSKYWVVATKAEAYLGTDRMPEADASYAEAYALAPEDWMIATTKDQRAKLEVLLANPPLRYVADKD